MYFSRIHLDPDRASLADLARAGGSSGYRVHQAIWRLFAQDGIEKRDFLYRRDAETGPPRYYSLSAREPVDHDGIWHVETKVYAPRLAAGDRLAFVVTVNPVVSRRDEGGRLHRHDLVMDRKRAYPADGRPPMAALSREAGLDWLAARAEGLGFRFEPNELSVFGYQQHRLYHAKGQSAIRFSTLDFTGLLEVIDPALFVDKALFGGIGPAKGFGCGLLLVKRTS